jgi:hypothetical protein
MTRMLGLVSLVLALAAAGYLVSQHLKSTGPSSPTASRAFADAGNEVATLNLQQAALALEQFRSVNGTYFGADLGGFGVQGVRADAGSYCVQTLRAPVSHLTGPGGTPAAGPCPA